MQVYLVYANESRASLVRVVSSRVAAEQDLEMLRASGHTQCFGESAEVVGETEPPEQLKVCDDLLNGGDHEFIVAITDRFVITSTQDAGPCNRYTIADAVTVRRQWLESGGDEKAIQSDVMARLTASAAEAVPA